MLPRLRVQTDAFQYRRKADDQCFHRVELDGRERTCAAEREGQSWLRQLQRLGIGLLTPDLKLAIGRRDLTRREPKELDKVVCRGLDYWARIGTCAQAVGEAQAQPRFALPDVRTGAQFVEA